MTERCILCGFMLDENAVTVSEGKLCSDSMGCRRRALAQQDPLYGVNLAELEDIAAQRLLGALVGRHGWAITERTEEDADILAFVAFAGLRGDIEQLRGPEDEPVIEATPHLGHPLLAQVVLDEVEDATHRRSDL